MIPDRERILVFLAKLWCVLVLLLMLYAVFADPRLAQTSDYVMTFYVAGHLAATGQASSLYPSPDAASFTGSPFDQAAHLLLPYLPENRTAAYMYSPLVAWLFAPLSLLKPNLSLLAWQMLSLAGLAFSCRLFSQSSRVSSRNLFFLSFLFFPVFITLWIGQLGIIFGLLPLSTGFFLLRKNRPLLAGLAWSLLALKPQFLAVAGIPSLALALAHKFRCLAGMIFGTGILVVTSLIVIPAQIHWNWLSSLKFSFGYYSSGLYVTPAHLVTSLPGTLLLLSPIDQRASIRLPIYGAALALWLLGLWHSKRLAKRSLDEPFQFSLMLAIGVQLLPLISPHTLYYDLCMFLPLGVIFLADNGVPPERPHFKRIAIIGWISLDAYMILFLSVEPHPALPLVPELILLGMLLATLRHNGSAAINRDPTVRGSMKP